MTYKITYEHLFELFNKIRTNSANPQEIEEYFDGLHERGIMDDSQYDRATKGTDMEDKKWMLNYSRFMGAIYFILQSAKNK